MPYLIFTTDQYELDRKELTGASMIIGRAPECDVAIRDILLSRTHCRVEKRPGGQWRITDLESKNGTLVDERRIMHHVLRDGEQVRIGRTTLTFRAGAFEPAPPGTPMRTVARPSDPTEALQGTVAGFEYTDPPRTTKSAENFPQPRPAPREPAAYARDDVRALLSALASSSWDTIQSDHSRSRPRTPPLPGVRVDRETCDLSLQASDVALIELKPRPRLHPAQVALSLITIMLAIIFFGTSAWIMAR